MTGTPKISRGRLFLGMTLILVGVAYSLEELGWMNADWLRTYWPLILLAIGIAKLIWTSTAGGRFAGAIITTIGLLFLSNNLGWTETRIWQLWPALLVLVGINLVLSPHRPWTRDDSSMLRSFTFLGGTTTRNQSTDFQGGDLVAFMGGADVDLRQARISGGTAVIDAFAMWGGIDIKVPKDWSVRVQGIPLIGAFEDETEGPGVDDEFADLRPRQELVVKGFAIMGGVGVSH